MSAELDKCAHCSASAANYVSVGDVGWVVECQECGARTAIYVHLGDARDAWNARDGMLNGEPFELGFGVVPA